MSDQPDPAPDQPERDPHLEAALAEEQALLDRAMELAQARAQAQHLFDRAVRLNAAARRTAAGGES